MNAPDLDRYACDLADLDGSHLSLVGGKAANLGELTRLPGVAVPSGFCVTTRAFEAALRAAAVEDQLDRLDAVPADDLDTITAIAADIRSAVESTQILPDAVAEITAALARLGDDRTLAVRSSATVEDSPTASFAGQHDSYLDVDPHHVLDHVRRCWASLFSDRAVAYRARQHVASSSAHMAVVVQQMVAADIAGVMFTADPATSNRCTIVIEAAAGLGDSLVSGRTNTVAYRVRDDQDLDLDDASPHLLTRDQVDELSRLGRHIERHLGCPQDIEWCIASGQVQVVQTRPITALFPIPPSADTASHVYVSVGHNQMMTDAMTPLGLSVWQMTTPAPMVEAGSRLFVDVTARLSSPGSRAALLDLFGRGDPLMRDALDTVVSRDGFLPTAPGGPPPGPLPHVAEPIDTDAAIVTELIRATTDSIDLARRRIADTSGVELFDVIAADIGELRARLFDPVSHQATMAGIEATWWINDHVADWLGDTNAADALTQSAPNNVTSELGLALLDVADVIRPWPDVVERLQRAAAIGDDGFLDDLGELDGGPRARSAIQDYLARYGMRCVGEIDITRTRWAEQPSSVLPALLADVHHFEHGAAQSRFEEGRVAAERARHGLLARLRALPDGDRRAAETDAMIERLRTFIGYREHPKYGMISRYWLYKQALLREADRLVRLGVIASRDDAYFLRFDEFRDTVRTGQADATSIAQRRDDYRNHQALTPPRVTTSDGDAHDGQYRRDSTPAGTLPGLGVSGGTIRGTARVITDFAAANLEPGDVLVTTHTDPSWSPLFVTAAGLVTEVGGLMTHGAVVAREYGLPAVVAVDRATELIRDGQTIEVDGTHGHIRIIA